MRVLATVSAMLLFSLSLFLSYPASVGGAQNQEEREYLQYTQQEVVQGDVFATAQLQYIEHEDIPVMSQHIMQSNTFIAYNVPQTQEQTRTGIMRHIVSYGDTLGSIAEQYDISVQTLLWANDMSLSDTLSIGTVLTVLPVNGVLHTIDDSETLSDIAEHYEVDIQDILNVNDIGDIKIIFSGQRIIIPGATRSQSETVRGRTVDMVGKPHFARPAQGVLSQGLHYHNAIDIANACGSPVYASMSGIVGTVDEIGYNGGYGKYITVHHHNAIRTLYAHLLEAIVVPGQAVRQGEIIGYMGSTGHSTGCHVHFEVYGATNPVR